jgi:hypothetical protein
LLGIVAAASAEVDVRVWLTTQEPTAAGVGFLPGYGPFTPYATGTNDSGAYDTHQIGYLSPPPQPGSLDGDVPTFSPLNLTVEEPMGLPEGTPVYVWATFAGAATGFPAGMGAAPAGTKINGLNLTLVTTGSLVAEPHWYQVQDIGGTVRWETTSDLSGNTVTMVGVNSWGWQNTAIATDPLQNALIISRQNGGSILLGAIYVIGGGDLYVGLEYNGLSSNLQTGGEVVYFPGTETVGIPAGTQPQGMPARIGGTPEASWIPEPASLLLIGLGALILRRR